MEAGRPRGIAVRRHLLSKSLQIGSDQGKYLHLFEKLLNAHIVKGLKRWFWHANSLDSSQKAPPE
jgi:hypothetical protein